MKNDLSERNGITHSSTHYLMAIHYLKETQGYARLTDVARHLGLTKGSVSITLKKLISKQLIAEDSNHFLSLTESSHTLVHEFLSTRSMMSRFLRAFLGVDYKTAELDSCYIEYLLSSESQKKLYEFMQRVTKLPFEVKQQLMACDQCMWVPLEKTYEEFVEEIQESTLACQKRCKTPIE